MVENAETFTLKEIIDVLWVSLDKIPYYGKFLNSSDARSKITDFMSQQLIKHKENYSA